MHRNALGTLLLAMALVAAPRADAAEILRGPIVQMPGSDRVVIAWETDVPTVGIVRWGIAGGLEHVAGGGVASVRHEVLVEGPVPGDHVTYRVFSGAAHSRVHSFDVPPASGAALTILAFGDNRSTHGPHRAVVEGMSGVDADLVVNTGDLVNRGDRLQDWDAFFAIERPLLSGNVSFHIVGNHDRYGGGIALFERFLVNPSSPHAPERDFFVDAGRVRIVVLDNAVTADTPGIQSQWLESVLADGRATPGIEHILVFVHQGVHSNGPHGPSKSLLAAGLDDIMRGYDVDAVIAGHDHCYERGAVDGLRYVITGGGGAPVYKKYVERGHADVHEALRHFLCIRVDSDGIRMDVVLPDGAIFESCKMEPAPVMWNCG